LCKTFASFLKEDYTLDCLVVVPSSRAQRQTPATLQLQVHVHQIFSISPMIQTSNPPRSWPPLQPLGYITRGPIVQQGNKRPRVELTTFQLLACLSSLFRLLNMQNHLRYTPPPISPPPHRHLSRSLHQINRLVSSQGHLQATRLCYPAGLKRRH
jgi:hypothetical protein